MKLSFSQIREITAGAARVEAHEDGIHFYRFTKAQEELYKNRSEGLHRATFTTSGIRLHFSTNSQTLLLRTEIKPGTGRQYFAFDVFVNGVKADTLNNFSNLALPQAYTTIAAPMGAFSKEFNLGTGEKEVCVYFPWSVIPIIQEIGIDDQAFVKPVKQAKKLLCFGDSITHGYDALFPSNKYVSKLADALSAEEYNKAIGGEIFFPELAALRDEFAPDYITVAYGTNDWDGHPREKFNHNAKEFFYRLRQSYPNAKIIVITPIWRKDHREERAFGKIEEVEETLRSYAAALGNIAVVHGFDLVPHDATLYADLRLHPNDNGFAYYHENLLKQVQTILQTL